MADTPEPIDPDRILEHPFTAVRRGYDPLEVQRYLLQVANQLRAGREREAELRHQAQEADKRAAPMDELDPAELTRLLGQETARVLEAAQSASAEIRAKAEENVARMLREARDESQQMREDAESVLSRKTAEAEEAAAAVRAEADGVLEGARAEAAQLVEAGRQEGREMVGEAQKVRQRMLDDLGRRRKLLRQQIEQLQAGRDRLLAAYDVVRETLDVATEELAVALPEAKLAAETASLGAADEDDRRALDTVPSAEEAAGPEGPEDAADADAETDVMEPSPASADEDAPEAAEGPEPAAGADAAEEGVADADEADGDAEDEAARAPEAERSAPAEPGDDVPEAALGVDEPTSAAGPADPTAPDPVEGRHSSSVRVVRSGGGRGEEGDAPSEPEATPDEATPPTRGERRGRGERAEKAAARGGGDKAASVFARLRQEEPTTSVAVEDRPTDAAAALDEAPGTEDEVVAVAVVDLTEVVVEESVVVEEETIVVAEVVATADPDAADDADDDAEEELDPAQVLIARRDAALADLERNLARRIKRELSDEQNELLASLASAKGSPAAEDVLPAPEAHVERFQAVALPSLAAAATAGADLVSTVAGPPAQPTVVADLATEVAADIVAPLRERLERAFAAGDGHPDDVAQSIRASYREWKGQRVDQIAAHAVVAASNRGLLDRLPDGAEVRWVVADGDAASPDCEDNALAGAVAKGEEFPTGHVAPPLHATCRCMVVPAEL